MASIFNIAKHSKKPAEGEEATLLAMWAGRDADVKTECICVRWSPNDEKLAAGCGDGLVRLFDKDGKLTDRLGSVPVSTGNKLSIGNDKLPVMAMRWRPDTNKMAIRVAGADGIIELYDIKTKQVRSTTKEVDSLTKKQNQTLSMDYNVDGTKWATGGQDRIVRVYDESNPKECVTECRGSTAGERGHTSRVCAVKFSPDKPSVLASAGMDGTVLLWDTRDRSPEPFCQISDVMVCGDALDIKGSQVLVGSWRPGRQLQVYDMRKDGELIKDVKWNKPKDPAPAGGKGAGAARWLKAKELIKGACNVYGAQYVSTGPLAGSIVAGGTGNKQVKVFSPTEPHLPLGAMVVQSGVHGLHVNNAGTTIAIAACDGTVYGVKMPIPHEPEPAS